MEARENLSLSQTDMFAQMQLKVLDISASALSLIEVEKRRISDYELAAIAEILDVDIDWLLGIK